MKKIIVYDDYNSNIQKNQDLCGTVTTMFGRDSLRHGYKLIEYDDGFKLCDEGSK